MTISFGTSNISYASFDNFNAAFQILHVIYKYRMLLSLKKIMREKWILLEIVNTFHEVTQPKAQHLETKLKEEGSVDEAVKESTCCCCYVWSTVLAGCMVSLFKRRGRTKDSTRTDLIDFLFIYFLHADFDNK